MTSARGTAAASGLYPAAVEARDLGDHVGQPPTRHDAVEPPLPLAGIRLPHLWAGPAQPLVAAAVVEDEGGA